MYILSSMCRRPWISPDSSTLVSHFGTASFIPVDVRAVLAIVFGSHPVPCFLEYPFQFQISVPLQVWPLSLWSSSSLVPLEPHSVALLSFQCIKLIQLRHGYPNSMFHICVPSGPLWYTQWISMYPTGPSFWASQLCLCILIRAWVCPPCPYIAILPHSVFEAMYMSSPHILDPIVIIMLYPDTSMGMPASSIWSDDSSSIIEVMYF